MYFHAPEHEIPRVPPVLVSEVVSPDESDEALLEKLEDYRGWGVPKSGLLNQS